MIWKRRERLRVASEEAFEAKSVAAQAFITVDTSEDHIQALVHSYAQLDQGASGARMRRELSPSIERAEAATADYLAAVEKHPIDGDVSVGALKAATRAFANVLKELEAADAELAAFGERIAPELSKLDGTLHELATVRKQAREALERARLGVTGLAATGLRAESVETKLAAAERRWRAVSAGPDAGSSGLAEALRQAREAAAAATAVQSAAAAYVALVSDTRQQLGTVADRLAVVTTRIGPGLSKLSNLRRQYARGCSEDLDYVPDDARANLDEAKSALVTAQRLAKRNLWEDAATALSNARRRIERADAGLRAVDDRVRRLAEVAANPKRTADDTWVEVKRAQRFVVAADGGPQQDEVHDLDALAARVEAASSHLAGPHPNYWSYVTELPTISTEAGDVLERARRRLSSG